MRPTLDDAEEEVCCQGEVHGVHSRLMSTIGPLDSTADIAHILLVDDEERNLDALESLLGSPNHVLVRARSGDEALLALLEQDFAVILLDVRMPDISGINLTALIKQRKRSQGIPILFLTAQAMDESEVLRGYDAGAVDYLIKPVNPKILKTKIGVFVDLFRKKNELVRAEGSLRVANSELESRVLERTETLTQVNGELQRSSDQIQEREARYQQLIKNLPVAVYTTDTKGLITLYNEAAVKLWGRTVEIGKDMWCGSYKIFRPDGRPLPLDECPMAITLREGRAVRGQEIIVERPDGTRRNVLPYPDPIRDGSGRIIGATNMLLDITETKRAEAGLRQLAAIVESSEDAIISKNLNSIITSWNQGAKRLFGYEAEEVIGRSITILMPPDRWNEEPQILDRIRRGERMEHYETIRQRKDGTLIEISLTVSPIRDAEGKVVGVSKIVRDITAQKKVERELAEAHSEVLAASRAKDDFMAALSHELRTPLNPVLLLASDSARDRSLPPEVRERFETIRTNIEVEANLIDDLLDITRISHGKLSLNLADVNVNTLLKAAMETTRSEFVQKQIEVTTRLAGGNIWIKADPIRVQQVFWNILKNAAKFTPRGGKVQITTMISESDEKACIRVTDTGIGLTPQEINSIFNAFSQGEHAANGNSRRFGGLGLGLTISRMLVELHEGTLRASSEGRGQGATFTIELPLLPDRVAVSIPPNGQPDDSALAALSPSGMRILLVEDHAPTREVLTQLLIRRRHDVLPAISLQEARCIAGREKVDLVISDIGLPDGDGYTLMAELKQNFGLRGIALTGYGMEQDVIRGRTAGFVGHLIKPIRMESLDQLLSDMQF